MNNLIRTFLLLVCLGVSSSASAQTSTDLINQLQAVLDRLRTAVVLDSTVTVKVGESIQAALDAARDGTEIRIAPGVYRVNLVLRAGKTGIVLRSDVADPVLTLPWVTPALVAGKLATLVPLDPYLPVITTAPGAHDYTLRLLEVGPNLVAPDRGIVDLGDINQTALAQVAYNIHVDRCYVHGSDERGGHRGVMLNTRNSSVTRSYISNFWESGRDSQAVAIFTGPGPFLIENNYLEGSGENMMVGGVDPKITGLVPSDITVRGNYFYKPPSWRPVWRDNGVLVTAWSPTGVLVSGHPGATKNLFELKNAARVLIENNVFENSWPDAQNGAGILFTIRNQDGGAPWATVRDVVFQYNVVKNVGGFFVNMLGLDNIHPPSVQGVNMTIQHNLALNVGAGFQVIGGYQPTTISHNTVTGIRGNALALEAPGLPPASLTFTDNVLPGGLYGVTSSGLGVGVPALLAMAPGAVFHHNVIEDNVERFVPYPAGNFTVGVGALAGRLDAAFRYTGPEASSDGTGLGADVVAIKKRIPWASW